MKSKRILSLLLSVVMLLSLLPSGFATGETTPYTYVFSKGALSSEIQVEKGPLGEKTYADIDSDVSHQWQVSGTSNLYNVYAGAAIDLLAKSYLVDESNDNFATVCFGVKIHVEEGGTYLPSLTYTARTSAPIFDVYLVKEGTRAGNLTTADLYYRKNETNTYNYIKALDDTYKLGTLDMWAASSGKETERFDNIERTLDDNSEYYLLFRAVGKNEGFAAYNSIYLYATLHSFTLTPKAEEAVDELTSLSLSSASRTVLEGETLQLTVKEVYSLSGEKPLSGNVTYESSDENIAEVSQSGVVTGKKEGSVRITATLDSTEISGYIDISVKEKARAKNEYTYSFNSGAFNSTDNVQRSDLLKKTFDDIDASASSPWRLVDTASVYNSYTEKNALYWNAHTARADDASAAYAVELKLPESGTYIPKLNYVAQPSAPIVDVYLVENGGASGFEDGIVSYIQGLDEKNKLARLDMHSQEKENRTAIFDELYFNSDNTYYLLFRAVGKNDALSPLVSGENRYFEVRLSSFNIKPPIGNFDKAVLSVRGLSGETAPMANMTSRQLEFTLYDDIGISFDEVDEAKLFAAYSSSDEGVATVDDNGVITAHNTGETLITADITYGEISRSAEYHLIVEPSGKNMMENSNPDFEEDIWVWDSTRNDEPPAEPVFMRTGIATEEKDGDVDNRALAFTFDPDVPMPSGMATVFLKRNEQRIEVEPGRLYQLTFKVKTDIKKPIDGGYPTMRYSIYAYNNPSGQSGSDLVYVAGRDTDINNVENWQETFSEWQEFSIPITAPTEYSGDVLYISPRINIRYPEENVGKTGYSGTIWMDDFELREVGFEGIEMEVQGDPASGSGGFNVVAKPYTTIGSYISVDSAAAQKYADFSCSDEYVVSSFKKPTAVASTSGAYAASAEATAGGKNATAEIFATLTIGGVSRTGKTSVTTAGYDIKLLYADVKTYPASVEVGNGAQVEVTGYMSDTSVADMSGGRIIYESLTPEVISVDESGKITTLRAGKGKVAATLVLNSHSAYAEGEITVTDSSAIESASLSGPGTVGYLRDEPLIITGKMASGYAADIDYSKVKWIIGSDPLSGIEIIDGNLVFGNIKGAKATISAEITMGGETVATNEIEIEVVESDLRDFVVNFGGANEKRIEDVTIDKYGWQIDNTLSAESVGNTYLYNKYLYVTTNGVGRDFAIDFNVPYTGNYTPVFTRGELDGYGAEYVYIYIDGKFAGETSFCSSNLRGTSDILNLRSVYLEKGTHKLTLRPYAEKEVSRNYYIYPAYVRFAAIAELPQISEIITTKDSFTIEQGGNEELLTKLEMTDGFIFDGKADYNGEADTSINVSYSAEETSVASVSQDGIITANDIGETKITISAEFDGNIKTKEISVRVVAPGEVEKQPVDKIEIEAPFFVMSKETEGVQLTVVGKASDGTAVDLSGAQVTWVSDNTSVAEVSDSGYVTPQGLGSAKISVSVVLNDIEKTGETYISVREGKVGRTYFTDEMVTAAQENAQKYSWAKSEAKAAIEQADKYLGLEDTLWELVPGEGIPRGISVGFRSDPDRYCCRYCGVDLQKKHGTYSWISNPLQRPWKIQCPDCKRLFPSNEFDKFYELGRDEHGIFNRELALARHEEMFGGTYGTGYLKNTLYPEIGTDKSVVKLTGNETPEKWGVDDGFGYDTGRVYPSGCKEVHTYIAYYMHYGLWHTSGASNPGTIENALKNLSKAYMYTGDEKYGRVGAILLDRIADVYPGYDLRPYLLDYSNSDGGARHGKILGAIWENSPANAFSEGYDALFPMYDDPYVVSFLAEKAKKYNNTEKNDKSTPEKIRKNLEDGILREIYREVQRASISGNFGMHQAALARAAVVLDNHPETDEMFKWLFQYSETDLSTYNTGGEINKRLVENVSRDGQGSESAPGYNRIWVTQMAEVASVLSKYEENDGVNLYQNPKYIAMIKSYAPLTVVRRGLGPIGDSGTFAMLSLLPDDDNIVINAFKETKDIEIAQHLYFIKDGDLKNIHYDIFTPNPESLSDEVEAIIEEYGEYNYDESSLLTGYGFAALRDGTLHQAKNSSGIRDTQHDFWMYFGGATSHSHKDKLNLGIEAYGIPLTSDLGYPETANKDPNRGQWQSATLSHNTVLVNEKSQDTGKYSAVPLHFDQKDMRVKVLDVDASVVYATADEYRRTVVMVNYDDEISYGIDFFKILGGNDHLYSFHACSEEDPEVSDNLNLKAQETGSYAGVSVPYGADPWSVSGSTDMVLKFPEGYTWLDDVKRAYNTGTGEFYADFKIKDYWKQSRNGKQDIHLRMTMMNDWAADEVALANGMPPRSAKNLAVVDHVEYMLVRRKGRDLNTLFTTVIEPYDGSRYINSIENVPVTVVSGTPGKTDAAKAVKVELIDGRIDYIVYAQNNSVTYNVGDVFEFRGFVGVWTTDKNGVNIYSYVNDGEMIGDDEFKYEDLDAAVKGTITDFQDELSFDNWIEAKLDVSLTQEAADELSGRIINVERETPGNSTYVIESVDMLDSTHARINLGNVTLISGFVDAKQEDLGYKYDVDIGKTFDIPLSYEDNSAPVFDDVSENISTSAGSSVTVTVNATGDEGATVTYRARTLPRGASLNSETGTFTWKPDSSQVGDNLVAIDAVDNYGRISTQYFTVTVYGSTTGSTSNKTEDNTDTPAGGGGGGGGAAPDDKPETGDDKTDTGEDVTDLPQDEDKTDGENTEPDASGETDDIRFTDIGNHAWAENAINSLADDGIIKGTTARTFSPAANITRADFASLLVRAFKLTSDNTENFADVSANDYFASELAIARNTGIINGIGDNKYAPRSTITRQDMMVIVYRALNALASLSGRGVTEGDGEGKNGGEVLPSQSLAATALPKGEPSKAEQYTDFTTVASYAQDAVSALISAGIVNGKSGRIAPTDCTTRAEVAVLIKRILDYIK